jgi:putative thioredoxin
MENSENIIDVSEATFETDVIQQSQNKPVVVDFWAPWCGPCRMLGPLLEKLAADPELDFVLAKVNVDENPQLSMRYQVQGIPAVKAFVDGEVADEFVGAQPEQRVRQFIEKLVPSEVDLAFREASSLLATRHWSEAEDAFRAILEEHPRHNKARLGLARALMAQGSGCEALELLELSRETAAIVSVERLTPLASYLCQISSTSDEINDQTDPIEAQYVQAGRLLQRGNLEAALDGYLDVLRQDKRYRDGEPKDIMLGIFELLGDDDPLTHSYRRELAMVLF